ncbi:MAG: co-chaperone GroES [Oscillospiraceae bacterium]|jgi:chaperonin GroES|nr:co-chaperone GroES [Oscillospiraceae bacterium]
MNVKPLGTKVLLKQEEAEEKTKSGILLPSGAKEKPIAGIVVEVGPGEVKDGKEIKMFIQKGQRVIYNKYSGTEVKIGDEEYRIVDQSDILATIES